MASLECKVRIIDSEEFKALMQDAADRIEELTRERDQWEERFEDLLEACGGVWPG
jgi:lipase chaperone LimK